MTRSSCTCRRSSPAAAGSSRSGRRAAGQPASSGRPAQDVTLAGSARPSALVDPSAGRRRLYEPAVARPLPLPAFLARHGRPIRYGCGDNGWPIDRLPDRFARRLPARHRARIRGDAVRRAAFTPSWSASRSTAASVRTDHAPHRRVVPRVAGAAVRRAVPGAGDQGPARQRGPRRGYGSSRWAPPDPGDRDDADEAAPIPAGDGPSS